MNKTILTLVIIILVSTIAKAQWEQVGDEYLSHHKIYEHSIAINSEGTPYVLYITQNNPTWKEIRVQKFNGTTWETVGEDNIIESDQFLVTCPYIKIDADDNIFISYHFNDYNNTGQYYTIVRKFNETNWEKIGEFTSLVSEWSHRSALELDNNGNPHVLYYAGNNLELGATTIQKYNGTAWEVISETTLTANSWVYHPGMAIDNDNNIYVAYANHADETKRLRIDKFNGTTWENIGEEISEHGAIDQGNPYSQQIVVDNSGFVHVACITDPSYSGGNPGFVFERYYFNGTEWLGGIVQDPLGMSVSLTTDNQRNVYCTYRIIAGTSQAFVQKFENNEWSFIGQQPVAEDFTLVHIAIDNEGTPYIIYKDYTNDEEKSSVKKYIEEVNIETTNKNNFTIYPNPSTGTFTIENLHNFNNLECIEITDITGKIIHKLNPAVQQNNTITIKNSGIYFINIIYTGHSQSKTGTNIYSEKIIIQ